MSDMVDWVSDIHAVVEHLTKVFGYRVELIIGHSKGAFAVNGYLATYCIPGAPKFQQPPKLAVSVAGRIRMERIHDFDSLFEPEFEEKGFYEYHFRSLGKNRSGVFTPQNRLEFENYPMREYIRKLPLYTQFLAVHGLDDQVVPTKDSTILINVLNAQRGRAPGSAKLEMIEDGNHNFTEHSDELLNTILLWVNERLYPSRITHSIRRGAFVVVEGLDRAGKSTQVARIVETFGAHYVKFPDRSTAIGGLLNNYLTEKSNMDDHAVHLLFSANRWEVLPQIIDALKAGRMVVCDRYAFSGIAYSAAKGLDLPWCAWPDVGLPLPDVTIFLDVDDHVAMQRSEYGQERYEKQAFQSAVRTHFNMLESMVRSSGSEWVRIDACGSVDNVWSQVKDTVLTACDRTNCGAPLGIFGSTSQDWYNLVRHTL